MNLAEILQLLGAQNEDRNGVQRPGVYSTPKTSYELYDEPGGLQGYVKPFVAPNTAKINATTGYGDDPIALRYTTFHEAAHVPQPTMDHFLEKLGLGNYAPLSKNEFPDYSSSEKTPPTAEALATLRGMEAMMPTGKTIWDMNKMGGEGKTSTAEDYLQQTLKNNPTMNREGAKRLIDVRMFPEHSVMHESKDFVPLDKLDFISRILRRRK